MRFSRNFLALFLPLFASQAAIAADQPAQPVKISGVYPHLAMFNGSGECGIGAVVPWAGKLWVLTYPPHLLKGSDDKLYAISPDMSMEIRPESNGGTHANRLIHRESNQLVMGYYFIDDKGTVRAIDPAKMPGRMTATARHLTDPAGKVYNFDMEGALYEVDVKTLEVKKLFARVAPGAHGKGGYTSQGKLVVSNNGDLVANKVPPTVADHSDVKKDTEAAGVLAQYDGKEWKIIERRQFTEVTGPGGIYGAPDDNAPLWAIGWDKRSVILMLLDGGQWHKFRLPKGSHANDAKHGWYTEWPRIREIEPAKDGKPARLMMDMHGTFFDFPQGFGAKRTAGISPIGTHLRYVPDFGHWNGKLVIAADDCSIMQNPMAGISQSNLWFGSADEMKTWGPKTAWGGVWLGDDVKAGQASDPFLVNGYDNRMLHLAHNSKEQVEFKLEVDQAGDGKWVEYATATVPGGYSFYQIVPGLKAQWMRVTSNKDCRATAYFHYTDNTWPAADTKIFDSLANVGEAAIPALVRAAQDRNLDVVVPGAAGKLPCFSVDEKLQWRERELSVEQTVGKEKQKVNLDKLLAIKPEFKFEPPIAAKPEFQVDAGSVIMIRDGKRYRLPKGDAAFDKLLEAGSARIVREVQSERYLMNVHGTFYELPRDKEYVGYLRPVASHSKQIIDFCSWRGLLVMTGVKQNAKTDGHAFFSPDSSAAIWCGKVDDLWQLGQPVGVGGPWAKTAVKAGEESDPYLMTGYATKKLEITVDAPSAVQVTVEVDVDHTRFRQYKTLTVEPGKPFSHEFPAGYSAHWVRLKTDKDCTATATFTYGK